MFGQLPTCNLDQIRILQRVDAQQELAAETRCTFGSDRGENLVTSECRPQESTAKSVSLSETESHHSHLGGSATIEWASLLARWYALAVGAYAGPSFRTGEADQRREIGSALGGGEAYGSSVGLAIFHSHCGEIAAAHWRERGIEGLDREMLHLLQGALGEPLRASGHWPRLAAPMNLPAAQKTLAN